MAGAYWIARGSAAWGERRRTFFHPLFPLGAKLA